MNSDDVHGGRVIRFVGAVRDREALAIDVAGLGIEVQLVAEQAEEGDGPGVAGHAGGGVGVGDARQAMLKDAPQRASIGECSGDLVRQVAAPRKAEIGRALTRKFAGQKLVDHIRPEKASFDAD